MSHNYLYVRLNNCGNPAVERAATELHDLRNLRNVADYDVGAPFSAQEAADAVVSTEGILSVLDALNPTERSNMTDAMKSYEQGIGEVTWRP